MKEYWVERVFKYLFTGLCVVFSITIIIFFIDNIRVTLNALYFIITLITVGGFLYELGNYLHKKFSAKN